MNMLAYEELVLSIDDNESAGKVAFKIVKKSKTAENADGDAHLAWTGLKRKYAPTTAPTLANPRFIGLVVQRREVRVRQRLFHGDPPCRVKLEHFRQQIDRQGVRLGVHQIERRRWRPG